MVCEDGGIQLFSFVLSFFFFFFFFSLRRLLSTHTQNTRSVLRVKSKTASKRLLRNVWVFCLLFHGSHPRALHRQPEQSTEGGGCRLVAGGGLGVKNSSHSGSSLQAAFLARYALCARAVDSNTPPASRAHNDAQILVSFPF